MAKGIFNLKQANQAIRQDAWTAFHPPKFVEYLIVGGGGGGGGAVGSSGQGGGGGAGGLLSGIVPVTTGASYTITVGSGGSGTAYPATSGTSSVFNYVTAFGGGGGGNYNTKFGLSGGSGGGAGGDSANTGASIGGEGIFGQGNKGGSSIQAGFSADGGVAGGGGSVTGGGGGAGTVGTDSVGTYASGSGLGGTGGSGLASAITGIPVIYAGGGGGSSNGTGGLGGVGGGGLGGTGSNVGVHGSFGFGGGGGGHYNANSTAGNGGTGVVIIRYPGTTQFYTGGTLSYGNGHIIHTFYATGTLAPTAPTLYANPDYQISRSLRFNPTDTTYLNRTPATATNRKTWTWSGWIKVTALGLAQYGMFSSRGPSSGVPATTMGIYTDDSFAFNDNGTAAFLQTTQLFRDLSAWYHIVVAVDTTQATSNNRIKIFVNGAQVTSFSSATYPAQNSELAINSTLEHNIGKYANAGNYANAYMTEINFIDGQALTPSSFGWTNPTTGVWAPIKFVGTYGTNGFYVNFSDNSNVTAATLGADSSGNGNNWTPNNFSVSAGAGNDSLVDSPTSYGVDTGVGGTVRGNYCTLSPLTLSNGTLSDGNLTWSPTGNNGSVWSTFAVNTGKWYFEMTKGTSGDAFISISQTPKFSGFQSDNDTVSLSLYMYYTQGSASENRFTYNTTSTAFPTGFGDDNSGTVYGVTLDFDAKEIIVYRNNDGTTKATFTMPAALYAAPLFVGYSVTTTWPAGQFFWNFGQRPFAYTAPSGFKALCTQNLPTPTIGATAATLASKYFSAITYSGNAEANSNNTQNISTPFYPDLVWVKGRSGGDSTYFHRLTSTGLTQPNYLSTNDTAAEQSLNDQISALASTHFQVKAAGGGGTNQRGSTYVAWAWNAGNGTLVTNTSGSITSQVSANPTAGFSVVTYTSTTGTVGHGLGVAPSMIIMKGRNVVDQWTVGHASLNGGSSPWNYGLPLNDTATIQTNSGFWNNTAPTSTVFSQGSWDSGYTKVAYCFAPVAGYSAFGTYTGNGSATDGPFVHTGFRPRFILLRKYDVSTDWQIIDTARDTYNAAGQLVEPNATNAESDARPVLDILSNGFKLRYSYSTTNQAGASFIYAAFAETPFKYSLAR
jgi:hypothetical protein